MHTHAFETPPKTCGLCELANAGCDVCGTKNPHCMKYHAEIIPGTAPCEWRSTAILAEVQAALVFGNHQLAEYYSLRHMRKTWGKVRGITTRMTVTADLFGRPHEKNRRKKQR